MPDELVFYTNPMSRGRIVRWMLEEVGRPYRTEVLDFGATMKAPAYLAINPMGKVPALRHGETVVTEVAAICTYLADAFPEAALAPPHADRLRGPYYRWLFYIAGPLETAVSNKAMGFQAPEGRARATMGYGCYEDVIRTLAGVLAGREFLVGDTFTAADVLTGSHLGFGMQFGTIAKQPVFEHYVERLAARPAAARARAIDDALIAERAAPAPA